MDKEIKLQLSKGLLSLKEKELNEVFNHFPIAVAYINHENKLKYFNQKFFEFFGESSNLSIDNPIKRKSFLQQFEKFFDYFEKAKQGQIVRFMDQNLQFDGLNISFDFMIYPFEENNKIKGFLVTVIDYTQFFNIESRYEALFYSSTDIILITNSKGKILDVNPAFKNILGFDLSHVVHSNLRDYVFPEDHSKLLLQMDEIFEAKTIDELILRFRNEKESLCYISWMIFLPIDQKNIYWVGRDITLQLESQTKLEQLLKASQDGFWDINLRTDEIYVSPRFYEILGFQEGQIKFSIDFLKKNSHPEDKKRVSHDIDYFLNHHENSFITKFRCLTQSNDYIWLISNWFPVKSEVDGNIDRVLVAFSDISELMEMETERNYFFNLSLDILCVIDFNFNFLQVNPAVTNILGWDEDEFNKDYWISHLHPDDRMRIGEYKTFLGLGKTLKDIIFRIKNKNGQYHYFSWRFLPLPDEKIAYGIGRDVTEQVIAENKLKESNKHLEERLEYIKTPKEINKIDNNISLTSLLDLQELYEIQESFACLTDLSSLILGPDNNPITKVCNKNSICSLIRTKDNDCLNCNHFKPVSLNVENIEEKPWDFIQCIKTGLLYISAPIIVERKQIGTWIIGGAFLKEDQQISKHIQEIREYGLSIDLNKEELETVVKNPKVRSSKEFENIHRMLLVLAQKISTLAYDNLKLSKNLLEHKQFEKAMKEATKKAEESDQLKSAFLANMSHEIRSPLNAILGFSKLLSTTDMSEDKAKLYHHYIDTSAKDLLNLINDIIDISKIESNQVNVNISEFDIKQIMRDLYKVMENEQERLNKNHLSLVLNLPERPEFIYIESDELRFKQVFTNLVSNALKFTHRGSVELGFFIGNKNEVIFFVKDTGIGVSKENHHLIFERFRKIEEKDELFRGAGLGLTICKKIIEILGGRIWIESSLGKGTTFFFTISSKPIESLDLVSKEKTENDAPTEFNFRGKTILVAEDEEMNFIFLEALLKNRFKLIHAKNGIEALDIYSKDRNIDLILMDIKMPKMNGYQAAEEIRKINKTIPIIATTAYAMSSDRQKILDSGFDGYVSKPISQIELMSLINNLIN